MEAKEPQRGTLNRDLLKKDYKWLEYDLPKGLVVYKYSGSTYGCISGNGVAVISDLNEVFFQVPKDSVDWE